MREESAGEVAPTVWEVALAGLLLLLAPLLGVLSVYANVRLLMCERASVRAPAMAVLPVREPGVVDAIKTRKDAKRELSICAKGLYLFGSSCITGSTLGASAIATSRPLLVVLASLEDGEG